MSRATLIFHQAAAFHWSALLSECPVLLDPSVRLAAPSAVALGFACELYLKGLITAEGGKVQGFGPDRHDPELLFAALDPKTRLDLNEAHTRRYGCSLNQTLSSHRRTFIDWRYCYEASRIEVNLEALLRLADVLLERARSVDDTFRLNPKFEERLALGLVNLRGIVTFEQQGSAVFTFRPT